MKRARLSSGRLYPVLRRLEEDGWLLSSWEKDPPKDRPPRRLYFLNRVLCPWGDHWESGRITQIKYRKDGRAWVPFASIELDDGRYARRMLTQLRVWT